jgi:hypothetical protein
VAHLFADGAEGHAVVVVRRVNQCAFRQLEHPVEQAVELIARIIILEVSTTRAADQQRVAGF